MCVCVCVCVYIYIYIYLSLLRLPKKYHKLGCLNSRHLFLLVMKVGKFMTKVWVGLVFSEGSVPVPSVLKWWRDLSFSPYMATLLLNESPTLMTSFNFNYISKSLNELWELVMDRDAWRAAIQGVAKSRT